MKRVLAALLGAGLLLAGCGQNTPTATSTDPYADGIDHSWTASTAEGQRIYGALSQGLKSQDFNIGLSITATNGWGPIELNTSNGEFRAGDGKPITLNGKVYPTGLGVHADSEIHIQATGLVTPACTRFQADVGIDDEIGNQGSVVFQVFADGEKVFDSGVMTGASATQHIDVAIGNKSDLRFVVMNAGDGYSYDHADWAGAAITCATQATPSVTLDRTELGIYHLHSNTLQATFAGYPAGPVQLRLVPDPIAGQNPNSTQQPPPLKLDTSSVVLTGNQSQTLPISISAPSTVDYYGGSQADHDTYHLVASIAGKDVSSVPVTLTELQLNLNSHFEPDTITGQVGGVQNLILVTKIDPPLTGPVQITAGYNSPSSVTILSSGTTTGTGGEMRTPVQVSINQYYPTIQTTLIGVYIAGVADGYRDIWYGNDSIAPLYTISTPNP